MSINSTTVFRNTPTSSVSSQPNVKNKPAFSSRLETNAAAKKEAASTSPISHEALIALASDFKNGIIDKDEANSRFVKAVVDGSLPGKLSEKDREAMIKDIAEFFSDDPEFMNKLQKNLKDLA